MLSLPFWPKEALNLMMSIQVLSFRKASLYLPVAPSLGYTSIPKNVGSMRNSGFELSLNYRAVNTKDIKLEVFANATFGKNVPQRWSGWKRDDASARTEAVA